jgi:hypothetical protein
MSLLEALRNLDTPVEDGLDELAGEIVAKRLGLSATVAAQIERYQARMKRGVPVAVDEAVSVFRLAGRRPDASLVFADAGRRTARYLARMQPLAVRGAIRALPLGLGRRLGARAARAAARRQLGVDLWVNEGGARAESAQPLSILALPDGTACGFYGAALSELLRVLAGFEGAMIHERCRARGDPLCAWRASPVGGDP